MTPYKNEINYIETMKTMVYDKISENINITTINYIVETNLIKSHIEDAASAKFQIYYFKIINNEETFKNEKNFFKKFKKMYALQGIDNEFLERLEKQKEKMLSQIYNNDLSQLYFSTFNKARIKHGNGFKEKNLGSFFTKFVHTFQPNTYCALDNPIKEYFGLKNESFFISFLIISAAYKKWVTENRKIILSIREQFKKSDKQQIINHKKLTDLKLLDLIFWSKANRNHTT